MITKSVLICAISLGIGILVESANFTIEQLPKEDCDRFVKNINDQKRVMIKRLNISDGYELTWDPELFKEVSKSIQKGEVMVGNKNISSYGSDSFDDFFIEYGNQLKKDGSKSYQNIESVLSPIHKAVGCVGFRRRTNRFSIHCYFAPGYYKSRGFKGVPGSNCTAGYANHDGLCALIGSFTTTEKPLTQPPAKPTSEAKNKDSVEVTTVTSGSTSTSILIGLLLFGVSFFFCTDDLNVFD